MPREGRRGSSCGRLGGGGQYAEQESSRALGGNCCRSVQTARAAAASSVSSKATRVAMCSGVRRGGRAGRREDGCRLGVGMASLPCEGRGQRSGGGRMVGGRSGDWTSPESERWCELLPESRRDGRRDGDGAAEKDPDRARALLGGVGAPGGSRGRWRGDDGADSGARGTEILMAGAGAAAGGAGAAPIRSSDSPRDSSAEGDSAMPAETICGGVFRRVNELRGEVEPGRSAVNRTGDGSADPLHLPPPPPPLPTLTSRGDCGGESDESESPKTVPVDGARARPGAGDAVPEAAREVARE